MSSPLLIKAYIGLGSNLGDRAGNIARSLRLLESDAVRVERVSSLLENPAVGGPAGSPDFLNGAAELATSLSARALLERLLAVEAEMGRVRTVRWEPRVIDLDLLLYGDLVINEPGLTVPHPRLHERRFVLGPLAEIAGGVVHPKLGKNVEQLLGVDRSDTFAN